MLGMPPHAVAAESYLLCRFFERKCPGSSEMQGETRGIKCSECSWLGTKSEVFRVQYTFKKVYLEPRKNRSVDESDSFYLLSCTLCL